MITFIFTRKMIKDLILDQDERNLLARTYRRAVNVNKGLRKAIKGAVTVGMFQLLTAIATHKEISYQTNHAFSRSASSLETGLTLETAAAVYNEYHKHSPFFAGCASYLFATAGLGLLASKRARRSAMYWQEQTLKFNLSANSLGLQKIPVEDYVKP